MSSFETIFRCASLIGGLKSEIGEYRFLSTFVPWDEGHYAGGFSHPAEISVVTCVCEELPPHDNSLAG